MPEVIMESRLNWAQVVPEAGRALFALEKYARESGLDRRLLDLVKLRASQLNHCAYCIDMHWKDLRADGETEQRLYGLDAWRESPYYTTRERAALEWTEAVTLLTDGFVPDDVFQRVHGQFKDDELVKLTMAVVVINGWNRFGVSFRSVAGQYKPASK
jgi:AhpD family alkylhydroperoxidase